MFRKAKWMSASLFMLATAIVYFFISLRAMTVDSPILFSPRTNIPCDQIRTEVQKDIFFTEKDQRRHTRITCPYSTLTLLPKKGTYNIIEKMENAECLMQEKISQKDQQLRYFKALEGTYLYSTHTFLAHSVFLSFLHAEGNSLPLVPEQSNAFLKGIAKEVSLSFTEDSTNFQADEFKAYIHSLESLR